MLASLARRGCRSPVPYVLAHAAPAVQAWQPRPRHLVAVGASAVTRSSRLGLPRSLGARWSGSAPAGPTHFEVMGLERSFHVDREQLESAYKALQKQFHPDRFAQAGEAERAAAEEQSARVNEAVAVLRSPLRRAGYWMQLNGIPVLEEDQRMADAATMMEVMEVSEELEEAETQEVVDSIGAANAAKVAEIEAKLADVFRAQAWEEARKHVERLQMLTRLEERVRDWRR